ncbi:L-leucine ABC transporter membrane protein /L-isoleucine ABC transporter membrane protein /L-valine ABC transporter membrane protein [Plasticicumulans lactativorans]|uniref:L-leucine ABC transporter membrane protein /L-isoleucine ABC transporter membrane protein /L-valine ABC transporter membrane protein n=1 Tax=Plasticicumulans lactativorans TaxID=1133106 RepID=A0A4R2L335_9GAMM|nr:high-affinity branched-chain amino acid ABC transporter permease LivM [Plasticicumulans lactativorans]TCO80904.1 L-leucine ABC transporter membrane protein /L-isoleucine ABC transporter membrane protein /L-valine ABC transporter membrane protein [Plasticicumulans lactativorans]
MSRPNAIKNASLAALVTAVLTIPMLGLRLQPGGGLEHDWLLVLFACAAVFAVQLTGDRLGFLARLKPTFRLPAVVGEGGPWPYVIALLVALAWPFVAPRDWLDVSVLAMIYVLLGLGLNIVVGFAGLLDLGYVAFYAVGAYTYALLSLYFGFSFWECLLIGGGLAATFGVLLGFPVLRLRGDYLAIVTLGFGEIIRLILNNWDSLTHGPDGINNIPKPTLLGFEITKRASSEGARTLWEALGITYNSAYQGMALYLIVLLLVVFTLFVINRLVRMPVGRAWEALREDEIACRSLGLNPTTVKLSAFALGAFFAGIGGVFFAAKQGSITPESFVFVESAVVLAIVVLGGMGSQFGVILAALALTIIPELAREFSEYRMLVFGLVMVLMMIWRPQGLLPASRPRLELPQ